MVTKPRKISSGMKLKEYDFPVNIQWKVFGIYSLVLVMFILLIVWLFDLMVINGEKNLLISSRTNQERIKMLAPRGIIYDSVGKKLVTNRPTYSVYVKQEEVQTDNARDIIGRVASMLDIKGEELWSSYSKKAETQKSGRITLKNSITYDQYLNVLAGSNKLKGVYLNIESIRFYENSTYFANIIGYVGDPEQADIDKGIYSESQVGKVGVEKEYDQYLRGKEGVIIREHEITTGQSNIFQAKEVESGNNLYLTINSQWQEKFTDIIRAQRAKVKAFASAGVVMKASTGEIMALVTDPSYDNNLFAQGISYQDFQALINDPHQPLTNRAIALQLPPGSVMKVIGATAGLESGVINEHTKKMSNRCMDLPGDIIFCEADKGYIGEVNVKEALSRSSNIFFCKTMLDLRKEKGYQYYYDIGKLYGLGQRLGIDLPGEGTGILPSQEIKARYTKEPWYVGDECNTVIGQGYTTVTPLQMASVVSTVMNYGKVMKPYVVDKVVSQNGEIVYKNEPLVLQDMNISDETFRIIKEGLRMGAVNGTAGTLGSLPGKVYAKTGSSDAGEYILGKYYVGAHSWVIGCFEHESEMYCFTVMQQWGGRGYKTVPIMKKFINCVYTGFTSKCDQI